jgi:hypothetical protein
MGSPLERPQEELPNQVSMVRFLLSATAEVGARDNIEPFTHLYAAFLRRCSKKNIAPMSKIAFARELSNAINYEEGDWDFRPCRAGSGRIRSWRGIKLQPIWKRFAERHEKRQEDEKRCEAEKRSGPPVIRGLKRRPPLVLVRRFLTQSGMPAQDSVEPLARLFDEFIRWCRHTDHWPLSRIVFARALRKAGLEPARIGHEKQRAWRGFHIFTPEELRARWESPYWPFLSPGQR